MALKGKMVCAKTMPKVRRRKIKRRKENKNKKKMGQDRTLLKKRVNPRPNNSLNKRN
jgi:hypothetical protein